MTAPDDKCKLWVVEVHHSGGWQPHPGSVFTFPNREKAEQRRKKIDALKAGPPARIRLYRPVEKN